MSPGRAKVLLVSTGGTISMTPQASGGVEPSLTGEDLVKSVPALGEVCDLEVNSYCRKPGGSLTMDELAQIAAIVTYALEKDCAGAVIVQGTDSIEETAFVYDLLVKSPKPVVVTGAMRNASLAGPDGPANILASAIVAASPFAVGRGTMVVLNDEIHAARRAQKSDTSNPGSFISPGWGPLGRVVEKQALFSGPPSRTLPLPLPGVAQKAPVALIKVGLDDDGRLLKELPRLGYKGAVLEAMGPGHLPACYAGLVSELLAAMPVVLATRVPAGPVFTRSYSFPGSEMDTLARGAWSAGFLSSLRARILLSLLLAGGLQGEALRKEFIARSESY